MSESDPRPGRFRRWVLRPLVWSLTVLLVLLFLAEQLLDTDWARERARRLVAETLSERLDRSVEIENLDFSILPLGVEVRGLVIEDPDDPGNPLLSIPWASVEADLSTLTSRHVHLRQVRVERPRVSLRFTEDGTNLPELGGSGGGGDLELYIDHVRVDQAEILLDHRPASFSLRAREVRTRLEGTGEARLAGRALAEEVRLRLPKADAPLDVAVAGRFEIGRKGLDVLGFRVSHPDLDARVDGGCGWTGAEPRCSLDVLATIEGRLAAELGYFDDLRGTIETDGNLQWRPSTFGFRAGVTSPRLALLDTEVEDVKGQLVLDRFGIRLQLEESRWIGGRLSGTGEVDLQDAEVPVDLEIVVDDVGVDRVLADRGIPIEGAASRVDGRVRYRFPARDPLRSDGSIDLSIRSDPSVEGLPLEGNLSLRIEDGVLSTTAAALRADRQTILARGFFDLRSSTGRIDWQGRSLDIGELVTLLPLDDPDQLWLPTAGTGTFDGTATIDGTEVESVVHLELDGVATPSLDFDRVVGSFVVDRNSLENLRLELQRPDDAMIVTGRIPFAPPEGGPGIELAVDVAGTQLDALRPWIPVDLPLDGPVDGRVEVSIDGAKTSGRLTATIEPAVVAGVEVRSLGGHLEWTSESVEIRDATLLTEAGDVLVAGTVGLAEGAPSRLSLSADGLRLGGEPFASWIPLEDFRGRLDLRAELTGALTAPSLAAEASLREIVLGDRIPGSGEGNVSLTWEDDRLRVEGDLLGLLTLDGEGVAAWPGGTGETAAAGGPAPRPASFELRLASDDLGGLRIFLPEGTPPFDGSFRGSLTAASGTGEPWSARLVLDRLSLVVDRHPLESLEPVSVSFDPEGFRIESLWMANPEGRTEVFVAGSGAGWNGHAALDLRVQGVVAGAWIETFLPDVRVEGRLEVLGSIGGTLARPTLDGQGGIRNTRLLLPGDFPHAFEDLDGLILFYPDSIVLDHLGGRFANGTAHLEGSVDPRALTYSLRASGRDLELRLLDGWLMDGDVDLAVRPLDGGEGAVVTGTARLDRLAYVEDVPVSVGQLLSSFLRRQRLEAGLAETPLADIHVNLAIDATDAVAVRNNIADLSGSADLVLRGTLAQPVLFGRVDLDEGGQIVYNDTEYEVQRGRLTFANPRKIDPEVDLVATAEIREFDVTLILSGTTERLDADFTSDPPLPDLEVFRLLTTGDLARAESSQSISAASFLYGQAANIIGQRVGSLFGFDQFRIDPLTGSGDNVSNARVTVGKRISRDLYLTYSVDPTSTEEQRLRIEWQITEDIKLVLTQNGDGTYEADVRWENRF